MSENDSKYILDVGLSEDYDRVLEVMSKQLWVWIIRS